MLRVRKGAVCLVIFTLVLGGTAIYTRISTTGVAQGESPLILVWVDVPPMLEWSEADILDGNITSLVSRRFGSLYAPTRDCIWILVETTSDRIPELTNITNVLNVSIAEETDWKWDYWWKYRKIDPLLELQAQRMEKEFPGEKIEVYLSFNVISDLEADRNTVIEIVESLGGNVTRIGYSHYMEVLIPLDTLDALAVYNIIHRMHAMALI